MFESSAGIAAGSLLRLRGWFGRGDGVGGGRGGVHGLALLVSM